MSVITENLSQDESLKISQLCTLDGELEDADTEYYMYGYHTYSGDIYPKSQTDRLISTFTERNDLILDPFLGGGTTLIESKVLGRNAMVSTRLQDEIASIREGNTTLFKCENTENRPILDYPSLNDNLQHNTPKWQS